MIIWKAPIRIHILATWSIMWLVQCAPEPEITTNDGAKMILIPQGEFTMGAPKDELAEFPNRGYLNYESERPPHQISMPDFYIDRYEVTNKQFQQFLDDILASGDTNYRHHKQPDESDYSRELLNEHLDDDIQPVVSVSWYNAYAYCQWAGKRLPSEAEWEYAARGGDQYRKYPWGNADPDSDGIWWANYQPKQGRGSDGHRFSAPVGSFPDGVSPFGLMDMSGNVEEWVQDWYGADYYKKSKETHNPVGPANGSQKVIKGGSYATNKWHIRIATRLVGRPKDRSAQLGFRCARSL